MSLLVTVVAAWPAAADAAQLRVDGTATDCSDGLTRVAVSGGSHPWCSLARAATEAQPGDMVRIAPGRYQAQLRPTRSGTASAPITFAADAGAVIDAAGASAAVKLMGISHVELRGLQITGASGQGVWIENTADVTLREVHVLANPGAGVHVKASTRLTVSDSAIERNGRAGIIELAGSTGARYVGNRIVENGRNGQPYNGDGIQIGGAGAYVAGNFVAGNGDPGPYEHGIYTGAGSRGWTIEGNRLERNAAANIKAAGTGVVRYNRLVDGTFGLVLSDNPAPVTVHHNLVTGKAQHLVFLTTGTTAAQARLSHNTIVQSGRSTGSGDASAMFVNAASVLELRNNLVSYANPDRLGVALWVNDAARLGTRLSETNWFASTDASARHLAWNGSRVTLAGWESRSGMDLRSVASLPPIVDADGRVTSANIGHARGDNLGFARDFLGIPLPMTAAVDIGAHQTS